MSSYTVLGITPNATNDQVRLAYKHKALECHPDRNMNDKDAATRDFIEVNTAYHAILRERERKAARSKSSTSSTSDQKHSSTAPESADKNSAPEAGPSGSSKSSSSDSSPRSNPASTPKAGPSGSSKSSSSDSLPRSTPAYTPKASPSGSSKSSSDTSSRSTPTSTPKVDPFGSSKLFSSDTSPRSTPAFTPKADSSGSSKSSSSDSSPRSTPAPTPKAGPSESSRPSSSASSARSTPASTPSSSPFSTPASSPYSTPASSPASSTSSLPDDEKASKFSSFRSRRSTTCEDVEDEDDAASTAGSSTTTHTSNVSPDPGTSKKESSPSSKTRRTKLRKPQPKPKPTMEKDASHSSDDCKCSCHHSTSSKKPCDSASTSHDHPGTRANRSKRHGKRKETELKEYHDTLPSLKDYPTADLATEWTCPLPLSLEDIFHGKRLCYRITRRYLSGKTKGVVLDIDVPAGCRSGTKIVFRDAGHERRDGTKQDLVFLVQDVKHERFVRGYQWDGGDNDKDESYDRNKTRDTESQESCERGKETENSERKPHKRRNYRAEDLIMELRLPWVDRLKDEKARIVVSGIDGEELAFEVDCRNNKSDNKGKGGMMTGTYVIEGAGMPVRANTKGGEGDPKSQGSDDVSGVSMRGRLIVRWEILTPASSSSSKWESFKQIFTFGK